MTEAASIKATGRIRLSADERRALLKPPPILYHYCTASGLIGILQSKRIWAGDALSMNDTEEITYARTVAARVAARLLASNDVAPGPVGRELLESIADGSYRYWEWDHYFVACFSENADQLSQWRAYADDGLGFALGFRSAAHFSTGGPRRVVLERVIYDAREQDALLEPIVREAVGNADLKGTDDFLRGLWEVLAIINGSAHVDPRDCEREKRGGSRFGAGAGFLAEFGRAA